jgi:hypothetical protein
MAALLIHIKARSPDFIQETTVSIGAFFMSKKQMPVAIGGWMAWCSGIRELPRESRQPTARKSSSKKTAPQESSHAG